MKHAPRILPKITYEDLVVPDRLNSLYANMEEDYYWSNDYSAQFYITQAKAGFIAVTEVHRGEEFLLPELQKSYALLDFSDLHISRHARRIINNNKLDLRVGFSLQSAYENIRRHHRRSWLTPLYYSTLEEVNSLHSDLQVISTLLQNDGEITAGEIGYILGRTYTSLSGFSSRERRFRNHGTVQMVLLAQWLQRHGFAFWNLGQPYMPYKFALGAKVYTRRDFITRWSAETSVHIFSH